MNIDTGNFDDEIFPIPPKRVEPSAKECVHTPCPEGYFARYEWAHRAMKTHRQVRCPRCGLWAIWLPKAEAKLINKQEDKERREFEKAFKKASKKCQLGAGVSGVLEQMAKDAAK